MTKLKLKEKVRLRNSTASCVTSFPRWLRCYSTNIGFTSIFYLIFLTGITAPLVLFWEQQIRKKASFYFFKKLYTYSVESGRNRTDVLQHASSGCCIIQHRTSAKCSSRYKKRNVCAQTFVNDSIWL